MKVAREITIIGGRERVKGDGTTEDRRRRERRQIENGVWGKVAENKTV